MAFVAAILQPGTSGGFYTLTEPESESSNRIR
jgi:hypothetical protein